LRIVWSGGEPLLIPELKDYLLISKQLNNVNVVATNGTALPTKAVREHTDWFQISCPSTDRHIYENLCGADILAKVLYTGQKVIEEGSRVGLYIPLSKINAATYRQAYHNLASH
jgi:pyruvate-formate lyase-activating enzyme